MARSTYIYLVHRIDTGQLLAAFTVKYEANNWAKDSVWNLDKLQLYRTRDGEYELITNTMTPIPWAAQ